MTKGNAGRATRARTMMLFGPQPPESTQVRDALADLGVTSPVVLVTAGWQEREAEDEALIASLGVPAVNLRLHARSEEIFAEGQRRAARSDRVDPDLTEAYKARQERLRHMQVFYRMRLESADDVSHAIALRRVEPELLDEEWNISLDLMRQLDSDHLERCRRVHDTFDARWRLDRRASVKRHREELAALIEPAGALVIAGGHVSSLLNRLRLFDVLDLARHLPILAWSAGAMVLTERIVCFHDYPPYGKDIAQVLDAGFGLAPGLVLLPDPSHRVRLDERAGIGRFARRMSPATCLAMDPGAWLRFEGTRLVGGQAWHLGEGGEVDRSWRARPS